MKPSAPLPTPRHAPPRGSKPTSAVTSAAYQSWLDKQEVNGKSIGDLTREEAASAQVRETAIAKFIELVIAQIPLNTKKRIRDFITAEEADRYWILAHQQNAA
jgi:hypothetical protein